MRRGAAESLDGLADLFLVHDRPILRPVDDSVVRVIAGRETMLRRHGAMRLCRSPIRSGPQRVWRLADIRRIRWLLHAGKQIVLGPHIGDLDDAETRAAFARAVKGMTALYDVAAGIRRQR